MSDPNPVTCPDCNCAKFYVPKTECICRCHSRTEQTSLKKLDTPEAKEHWEFVEKNSDRVNAMPSWKRNSISTEQPEAPKMSDTLEQPYDEGDHYVMPDAYDKPSEQTRTEQPERLVTCPDCGGTKEKPRQVLSTYIHSPVLPVDHDCSNAFHSRTEQPRKSDVTGREIPSGTETECANFKPEQPEAPKMSAVQSGLQLAIDASMSADSKTVLFVGEAEAQYAVYKGKYYTLNHPECVMNLLEAYASHSQPPAEVDGWIQNAKQIFSR